MTLLHIASAVAIGERAILIEGEAGTGKSSLALALIDRGAVLIGDDGVALATKGTHLLASNPPNITGLIEVRNVGLVHRQTVSGIPVALVLRLDPEAPRYIEEAERTVLAGIDLPLVRLWPDSPVLALRAEAALALYGEG
ncbi:serine kinase [Novosphingobium flavum]|uniref:Serine kinase n=1 Tax=Novosphingobium flavum TaxID=1778672 RepID=A0A7X1FRH5_9SPHN|nr:serine kinase [Novosphingobium flavum]MBC2665032.1 serine kinase [Novosphingobium flavum]